MRAGLTATMVRTSNKKAVAGAKIKRKRGKNKTPSTSRKRRSPEQHLAEEEAHDLAEVARTAQQIRRRITHRQLVARADLDSSGDDSPDMPDDARRVFTTPLQKLRRRHDAEIIEILSSAESASTECHAPADSQPITTVPM